MTENPTIREYLTDFNFETFLSMLSRKQNEDAFFFAYTHEIIEYGDRPTSIGMYVWSWLKEHKIVVKHSKISLRNSSTNTIIFDNKLNRDQFVEWYARNEFKENQSLFPNEQQMLRFVSNAEHGYYLGKGHFHKNAEYNFELFHWLRTNVKSGLFYYLSKFFFTNEDDELQYTLRWKNIETTE